MVPPMFHAFSRRGDVTTQQLTEGESGFGSGTTSVSAMIQKSPGSRSSTKVSLYLTSGIMVHQC